MPVAEQLLDGADVVAVGEQVGREAVAEAMDRDRLGDTWLRAGGERRCGTVSVRLSDGGVRLSDRGARQPPEERALLAPALRGDR